MSAAVIHRYFAWKEKGYWRGQSLLTRPQIGALLAAFDWKKEVFASVQTYDEAGHCIDSPLFFDFDGAPERVLFDVRHFVQACEFVVNCTPRIYFSGNKGFHLVIDHPITHPQCHLLVKDFAEEIAVTKTLDRRVYRTQSLLRLPGSPASAPGYYKIQLRRSELYELDFEQIRSLAKERRVINDDHDPSKLDMEVMDAWLKTAVAKLPTYDTVQKLQTYSDSVGLEMTPCIIALLTKAPALGTRHESVFILAKFFKLVGFTEAQALETLQSYEHWSVYEQQERDVSKTVANVYHSRRPTQLGCKGKSTGAELMRDHCHDHCPFSANFPKLHVEDLNGVVHIV